MRGVVSDVVVPATLLLDVPPVCPRRSATGLRSLMATLNTPCGFALVHPILRVAHNHPLTHTRQPITLILLLARHRLHLHTTTHLRFAQHTFGSRFAEEAHFAALNGDDDFEHVCGEDCGDHEGSLEDCL